MKRIVFFAVLFVFVSGAFAQTSLKVAATPEPHAAILNFVKDDLKAQGITLQVIEMTDYPTLNEVLEAGDIDANFYQHLPYMESFNKERGTHLAAGLSAKKDGLFVEGSSSPYVNYIVVKKGNEKLPKITALVMVLQSDKVKNYINKTYPNGEVVAAF